MTPIYLILAASASRGLPLALSLLCGSLIGAAIGFSSHPWWRSRIREAYSRWRTRRLSARREREMAAEQQLFARQREKNIREWLASTETAMNAALSRRKVSGEESRMVVVNDHLGVTYAEVWKDDRVKLELLDIH